MGNQRGLLGNVVRDVGMPRDLADDQADSESRGDAPARSRAPRKRRPPITEKGKGRNLKICSGCRCSGHCRQVDAEGRALAGLTFKSNTTIHAFNGCLGDAQPQTRATVWSQP